MQQVKKEKQLYIIIWSCTNKRKTCTSCLDRSLSVQGQTLSTCTDHRLFDSSGSLQLSKYMEVVFLSSDFDTDTETTYFESMTSAYIVFENVF